MKMKLLASLLTVVLVSPALAEKPKWAGNGKPSSEQKDAHRSAMQANDDVDTEDDTKIKKEKKEKKEKVKGIEKQKEKKLNQEQKELDKGSEKGKESRETRKKWWKFWGE